jgi:hypothetical protein
MRPSIVGQDIGQLFRFVFGEISLHDFDTPQLRHFVGTFGEIWQFKPAVFPAMGCQKLGHAFHVPRWRVVAQEGEHDAVYAFMQQQMSAVVRARLIVQPTFVAARVTVEKLGHVGGQQPRGLESGRLVHQRRSHPPVLVLLGIKAKVLAPQIEGLIENLRQFIDIRRRLQIGIEHQSLAFEFPDAGSTNLGFIYRLGSIDPVCKTAAQNQDDQRGAG